MRIARTRSSGRLSAFGAMLGFGVVAGLVVLAAVLVWLRFRETTATADQHTTSLALADAYGLGGLARLDAPPLSLSSPIRANTVVTYYGTPRTPAMGILGQHDLETVADLLADRAARFDALNGDARVLPALHLVYAIAQPESPGDEGLYLRYVDDRTVRQMLDLARRRGFALILDLQIGHSTPLAEVTKIQRFLLEPDVFVALDPEFALSGSTLPGQAIGSIDASDINGVQTYMAALTVEHRLPAKMLIVHQFQVEMITNPDAIARAGGVDLVVDVDGYGPADIKTVKYQRYGAAPYAPYGGIKVFLDHDDVPMTEEELMNIQPRPSLFVYQ